VEAAPFFNEESLRAAVHGMWGEHGAHADVLDHLIARARRTEAAEAERDVANSQSCRLQKLLDAQRLEDRVPFPS
jgi:hypothetical protein